MPDQVHECVQSVLEDNPEYDESRAWAICNAQYNGLPVADSEWTVAELDGVAAEMDVLSRAEPSPGTVIWQSGDGEIAYFADLPDKYVDAIGTDAFVPPDEVAANARTALEADLDGEPHRRARQLVSHHGSNDPLPPEYVVEINTRVSGLEADFEAGQPDPDTETVAAFLAHGGVAAREWTDGLIDEMETVDEQTEQQSHPFETADPTTADGWQAQGPAAAVSQASAAAPTSPSPLGIGPGLGDVTKEGSNEIDVEALPDAYQEALEAEDFYVYGKASIEQFDREDPPHSIKIEMDALEDALDRFFESEDAPGIISLYHDDIPVGVPVREHELDDSVTIELESPDGEPERYEFDAGDTLTTHVEDGDRDGRPELWLLSNIAGDSEMAKEVRLRALEGQLNGYSVTIHRTDDNQTDEGRIVTKCDLHAVTLGTADIVKNAGSTFDVAEYAAFLAEQS